MEATVKELDELCQKYGIEILEEGDILASENFLEVFEMIQNMGDELTSWQRDEVIHAAAIVHAVTLYGIEVKDARRCAGILFGGDCNDPDLALNWMDICRECGQQGFAPTCQVPTGSPFYGLKVK